MSEALEKVLEEVNCPICLDTYSNPKILQCSHAFCHSCLEEMGFRGQELACPTCRQVTPIPHRGVASLPSAFYINRFLEIRELLQKKEKTINEVPAMVDPYLSHPAMVDPYFSHQQAAAEDVRRKLVDHVDQMSQKKNLNQIETTLRQLDTDVQRLTSNVQRCRRRRGIMKTIRDFLKRVFH